MVTLDHLGKNTTQDLTQVEIENNEFINDIYNAYTTNHTALTNLGYVLLNPNPQNVNIDKNYIYLTAIQSIIITGLVL